MLLFYITSSLDLENAVLFCFGCVSLNCCSRTFSVCGWGYSVVPRIIAVVASLVGEHKLAARGDQ